MPDADKLPNRGPDRPSSPYGPQNGRVDEAAGGTDSSPYENVPSGEKADAAADPALSRKQDTADPNRPDSPRS